MSTTSPTPTSSDLPSSPDPSSNNSPAPQSSTLYLFTFLATLLLLLAVSCAIVIRSFILRRRFRRRLEEALAAGVFIPGGLEEGGGLGRGRRRDFGEKPKLWEVWVGEHGQVDNGSHEPGSEADKLGKGEGKWEEIQPISATILSSNPTNPISLPGDESITASSMSAQRQRIHRGLISRLLGRRQIRTPSSPPSQDAIEDRNDSTTENSSEEGVAKVRPKEDEERVQVSVLISMPNPNARRVHENEAGSEDPIKGKGKGPGLDDNDGDAETDIPDVVFGVAEVNFRP